MKALKSVCRIAFCVVACGLVFAQCYWGALSVYALASAEKPADANPASSHVSYADFAKGYGTLSPVGIPSADAVSAKPQPRPITVKK